MVTIDPARICIFCLTHEMRGSTCTYAMPHEYSARPKPPAPPRVDRQLCVTCGLHPKNPASATNGCAHEYAASN
jgi:hypothetical protein